MSGRKNGTAIAGDFLSSASRCSATPAYLYGMDGIVYAIFACGIFLMVAFLIAEKLCKLGRLTFADLLCSRANGSSVAASTLPVSRTRRTSNQAAMSSWPPQPCDQYGTHRIFNNQTGGATMRSCTEYGGTGCQGYLAAGWYMDKDLTPINSITLAP